MMELFFALESSKSYSTQKKYYNQLIQFDISNLAKQKINGRIILENLRFKDIFFR